MKKKIICLGILISMFFNGFGAGMMVFDIEGWLKTIDILYANYDMVNNAITQIENQYKMISKTIEQAKSIDWENISFDGDFDIRNDIKNATSRINQLLGYSKQIKDSLTTPNISIGSHVYSVADLCGINGAEKNILAATNDAYSYMTSNMKSAIQTMSKQLTDKEKQAIMSKYGISPENYLFMQQSLTQVKEKVSYALGKITDNARTLRAESITSSTNLMDVFLKTRDSDGNTTQGAANETLLRYQDLLVKSLTELQMNMDDAQALIAEKYCMELNEKEREKNEEKAYFQSQREYDSHRMEGFSGASSYQ